MKILNFEFKAKVNDLETYENKLLLLNPVFKGLDIQTDTYFNVPYGRLKLREGNIENSLINYERQNVPGSRKSEIILYRHKPDAALKQILTHQFGIKIVVEKQRRIYFIENVKFHFDNVNSLGTFIEVEAIDTTGERTNAELKAQCDRYSEYFNLADEQMIIASYSDLLMDLLPDSEQAKL